MGSTRTITAGADRATLLAFAGVVVFGGANAIAVKATVRELDPFWSAALRFVLAGLVMAAAALAARRTLPRGRSLVGAMLYGAIGIGASYGCLYLALRDAPAGTAGVFIALVPLFTFGLAIAQGQERFHIQGLAGGVLALGGVAVIFVDQLGASVPLPALLLLILGPLAIAESGVIVKWIPRSDPFSTNAVAMLTGGGIHALLSLLAAEPWTVPTQTGSLVAIGYLVVFGSVVMFWLYVFALERWTASAVSYTTLLLPLVTIVLAAALFGERISASFLAGGAIILVGVYVGAFHRIRPRRSSATSLPECLPIDACAPPIAARIGTASPAPGR